MREYPITKFWYTRCKGKTIEEAIDSNLDYFEWLLKTFQDVTPKQALYYKQKTGKVIPREWIRDVEPYEWQKGDPEKMYIELCECNDLEYILKKYRSQQTELF